MILIISSPDDAHLPFVTKHLTSEFVIIDPGMVLDGKGLSYSFSPELEIVYNGQPLKDVKSVWLRKPRLAADLTMHTPPGYEDYARSAVQRHFEQLYVLFEDAFWLSDYYAVRRASNKVMQLLFARKVGFKVPHSMFTSDPNAAKKFINKHQQIITKTVSTKWPIVDGKSRAFFTTRICSEQTIDLDGLHLAPAIFQQIIEPLFDVRVTIVGGKVFAAKVILSDATDPMVIDWRIGHAQGRGRLLFEPYELPPDIAQNCLKLTKRLGLSFGAIDLICDRNGQLWFLEINPNGQWAFVEEVTGQPIGETLAYLLECGEDNNH